MLKKISLTTFLLTSFAFGQDTCNSLFEMHDYAKASKCFVKQAKKAPSFSNLFYAGASFAEQGLQDEGYKYLTKAESKAKTPSDFISVYSYLGGISTDPKAQLNYYQKALKLALDNNYKGNIGSCYNNLGSYYAGQSKYNEAEQSFLKALAYLQEEKKGHAYQNLGFLYQDKQAEEMYLKAIQSFEADNDLKNLVKTKTNLAKLYAEQKRYQEAYDLLINNFNFAAKYDFIEECEEITKGLLYTKSFLTQ